MRQAGNLRRNPSNWLANHPGVCAVPHCRFTHCGYVFLRPRELTFDCLCAAQARATGEARYARPVQQQQDGRKNYIGVVSEATEQEQVTAAIRSQPRMMGYLVNRLTAVFRLDRSGARP
jgi:hypothetical protein